MASGYRGLRRPTISVLCPTAHPGQVVATALADLREVVDEVIVAADARVGADDLGHYAQVADTLLRFEFAGRNRHWPWLAEQARGDWILVHDGDELVSSALLDALGDLASARRIHQYSMPIHWPWPDSTRRLAGEPWDSGHGLRLVRNDGRLAFHAAPHAGAFAAGPTRHLDALPIYHLNLVLDDRATREEKVARYDTHQFGLLTAEGLPVNTAYYVPESAEQPPSTTDIPLGDVARIERTVLATRSPVTLDPATVALADRARIEWYAPRRELDPTDYRASIALARPLPVFVAGCADHPVWVRVTNEGNARWPGSGGCEPDVRLAAYWQTPIRGSRYEAGRAELTHLLDPGETMLVPARLSAPPRTGPIDLLIDLVHENVRWFDCPLTIRVHVEPTSQERLDGLSARLGPLLPLAVVVEARRGVARPDGLLRAESTERPLADAELDDLTRGLPRGGWALDTSTIDRVVEVVREIKPETVVEFGSGTSTIVLAALLRGLHSGRFPRLVSIEHDASWAQRTRDALAERGLAEVVEVVYAPLGPLDDNAPRCYVLDEAATAILRENAPELILVDGPSLHSGASRLGALDLVAPFLERDAIVLLDDALRDAELCVADVWQRRPDVTVHGLRMTPVGLLEATLHPRDADRGEALAVATNEGASIPDAGARNDPRGRRFRGSRRRRG